MGKIKLLSLFSGIGAFEKALTNQKIEFDIVNYCEINMPLNVMLIFIMSLKS